jgi:hypothetical protein
METNEKDILEQQVSLDNEERRSRVDRRCFSYTLHIPERRKIKDRRSDDDRKKFPRAGTVSQ